MQDDPSRNNDCSSEIDIASHSMFATSDHMSDQYEAQIGVADILERISDAFILLDPEWRVVYANPEACSITRKSLDQLRGRSHWDEWPNSLGTKIETEYRRAMSEQTEVHFEHHYLSSLIDVWVQIDAYPTANTLSVFFRNITDRKLAEHNLQESEERYRSLIDATSEIVWTNDGHGEMQGTQAGWAMFTGQTESEYVGLGWLSSVHPEDQAATVSAWNNALRRRETLVFEHRVRRHDGVYRRFHVRAVPLTNHEGAVREWVGIHTDVTDRRDADRLREQLVAQQKVFLHDVLASVTEGKLLLSNERELPSILKHVRASIPLTRYDGLFELRKSSSATAQEAGHSRERQNDLMTAASEAGMNAIVHAGGGTAYVSTNESGTVQVRVEDSGSGISMENLPRAALSRGYSSMATLGHGLKMMLDTADRVYLMTGKSGTTVVLEQDHTKPLPAWFRIDES